jgi:hypothetical protein
MTTPTELDGKVSIGNSCIRIRWLADVAVHAEADAVRAVEFGFGEFCGACRRDVT